MIRYNRPPFTPLLSNLKVGDIFKANNSPVITQTHPPPSTPPNIYYSHEPEGAILRVLLFFKGDYIRELQTLLCYQRCSIWNPAVAEKPDVVSARQHGNRHQRPLASLQTDQNQQRQREGIASAKAKGKHLGRPPVQNPANWDELIARWKEGEMTAKEAILQSELSKSAFYASLNAEKQDVYLEKIGCNNKNDSKARG